jgi:L-malate glycosyltransferase
MRVLLLGENGSVHIQKWIKALEEQTGLELHVITFERGVFFKNVKYHFLKKITGSKLDYILNIPHVRRIIKNVKPDVVHAHYATSYGLMAAQSGFRPLIVTGWGADIFDSPRQPLMRRILLHTFKKADALTVLSEITKREISKYTDKEVQLIPFGVDTNRFEFLDRNGRDTVTIGTVRTLTEKYGVEYLIRAVAQIYPTRTFIRLSIVGDGPLREYLEQLTKELKIDHITQFHGYINQNADFDNYKKRLSEMDIFSILSIIDSETFGVASVEASACGLPVVATNVGGLPEVVKDKESGLLVSPKNVDATAKALLELIDDPRKRLLFGKNGHQYVVSRYNWENNVSQMVNLYKRTIESKK